jgi:hypothetical protein
LSFFVLIGKAFLIQNSFSRVSIWNNRIEILDNPDEDDYQIEGQNSNCLEIYGLGPSKSVQKKLYHSLF